MTKTVEHLIITIHNLKQTLYTAENDLKRYQNKCKHKYISSGCDSEFFYATCSKCNRRIRYKHNIIDGWYQAFQLINNTAINFNTIDKYERYN
jgi:hypothetical protein